MTAPTYDTLTGDDTGADKILTTGTVQALDTNPVSIAQRGTGAPIVQVRSLQVVTTPTLSWDWPDGVTAAEFILIGAGGGGDNGGGGTDGADTTLTYNSVTITAHGGKGADAGGAGGTGGAGNEANLDGRSGAISGDTALGFGRGGLTSAAAGGGAVANNDGYGYGGGGGGARGGGGGEVVIHRLVRVAGLDTVSLVTGLGGSDTGSTALGGHGAIFISY